MQYQYINGFENYIITNEGQVFSVKKQKYLTLTKNNRTGYYQVNLYNDQGAKTFYVHRLVAQVFIDNPNNYKQVDHIYGDKKDNNFKNLRWVSASDNQRNRSYEGTEFIETLPEDAYSFEQYNDHQFRNYYIDSNDIIYQKITDNRYKIMRKMKSENSIQINDEDNILRSISIPKLHNLNQELRKMNYLQQELLEHNEALSTIDEEVETIDEDLEETIEDDI